MIRDKIYEKLNVYFNEYLLGFDKEKLGIEIFSGFLIR